jgi:hypothetical protein
MGAPGPLSEDAAEADVLEQRAAATPLDDVDDSPGTGAPGSFGDFSLEADPADVAEQQHVVPMDFDDRDDAP